MQEILKQLPPAIRNLAQYDQWVGWHYDNGRKMPVNPHHYAAPQRASTTDSMTWGGFREAARAYERLELEGLGFVFTAEDPFVGIDLDDCRDPRTGDLEGDAVRIIDRMDTYTEVSPSETGLHLIGVSHEQGPYTLRNDEVGLEVYSQKRFFCITADPEGWQPLETHDVTGQLDWLLEEYDTDLPEGAGETDGVGATTLDPDLWVEEALEAIDPDGHYDLWMTVGMALHDGYNGAEEGFQLWEEWSKGGEKYEENEDGEMRRMWEGFDGRRQRRRTLRTVWSIAESNGWTLTDNRDDEAREAAEEMVERAEQSGPPIEFHDYAETYADDSPYEPDLVGPGLIGAGDMAMVFGPAKSEKTLMTVSACRQWAMGEPFLFMEPERPITTYYLNYELKEDSWRQRSHRLDLDDEELAQIHGNFRFTDRLTESFTENFARDLYKSIDYYDGLGEMDLFVIDPTINAFTGDDENDNGEVMEFIQFVREVIGEINEEAAVLMVHHTAKVEYDDVFSNLRGAGAFRGAYDTGIFVSKNKADDPAFEDIDLYVEARNSAEALPHRKIQRHPETGRYQEVSDQSEAQARMAGEKQGQMWDKEQARKSREILKLIRSEAEQGNVYTKSAFARTFANNKEHGLGSEKSIKRKLSELAEKRLVAYFNAGDYGGPKKRKDSSGHICVRGMVIPQPYGDTLEEAEGCVEEVSPEWFKVSDSPDPVHIARLDDTTFNRFSDYYQG